MIDWRDSEMARLGYARVSTHDGKQSTDSQTLALREAGCERIFEDEVTGASTPGARRGWNELLAYARDGQDTVVCYSLSRLGRSITGVVSTLDMLTERGIGFVSLTEAFDLSTPMGRMVAGVLTSIAQWEREVTVERVRAGLRSAVEDRGVKLGRRPVLDEARTRDLALAMRHRGGESAASVASRFGVSRATAYRALAS